jgi:phospholipid transport system substrate-binding protein
MTARFTGLLAAIVLMGAVSHAGTSPEDSASVVVKDTLDAVVAVLRDRKISDGDRQAGVEEIAYARFDFDTISRLVLARNWKKLDPRQRDQFVVEFKRHLSLSYWKTLDEYRNEEVQVTGARKARNGDVTVRTRVVGSDQSSPILIDYRMRPDGSDWVVIDVIIEGVSLVQNFRSQTQEIISEVGVDELIDQLREKNSQHSKG